MAGMGLRLAACSGRLISRTIVGVGNSAVGPARTFKPSLCSNTIQSSGIRSFITSLRPTAQLEHSIRRQSPSLSRIEPFAVSGAVSQVRWSVKSQRRKGKQAALRQSQEGKLQSQPPKVSKQDEKNFQRLMMKSPAAIVDPYIPAPKDQRPSLFSSEGLKLRTASLGKMFRSTISVGVIKRKLKVFDAVAFAEEAKNVYILAIEAVLSGDKVVLGDLCTPDAIRVMKNSFSHLNSWTYDGDVSRPTCVNVNAFATGQKNNENYFAQVTVQVQLRYAINGGEPVDGPFDYVVMERFVESGPASGDKWRICGRINPKNPPKVPARMQMPSFFTQMKQRIMGRFSRK